MKRYEFVDITTADVAFVAYGRGLGQLFSNAALAMYDVMVNIRRVKRKVQREVACEGHDLHSLLFNWLNQLLFYLDVESLVFSAFDVNVDKKDLRLKAKCRGEPVDPKRHEAKIPVKAATYHKMEIKKRGGVWRARVILDV